MGQEDSTVAKAFVYGACYQPNTAYGYTECISEQRTRNNS